METDRPAEEGGPPVRAGEPVPFFRASIDEADLEAVVETLRSGWLTVGPRTAEFEAACAARVQAPYAIATSSCTASLFVALKAFDVGPGDEVIVPSLTFASTIHSIRHTGAEPVLADIETTSFGLDPIEAEALVTPRTRGILAVDYAGQPCQLEGLQDVCRRHGLFLLEDAAHAFGAALGGRPVGSLSDATAFSFYATKCITTGEGGLLAVTKPELADRVRLFVHNGIRRDTWSRHGQSSGWLYDVELPGYKLNLSDPQAALGLSQLARETELRRSRTTTAQTYAEAFADLDAVELPQTRSEAEHAWHLYVVRFRTERLRVDRDHLARALGAEGIRPSVHFVPYHRHRVGRDLTLRRPLSRTEDFSTRCLSLPLFPHMPSEDVRDVIEAVRKLVRYYAR